MVNLEIDVIFGGCILNVRLVSCEQFQSRYNEVHIGYIGLLAAYISLLVISLYCNTAVAVPWGYGSYFINFNFPTYTYRWAGAWVYITLYGLASIEPFSYLFIRYAFLVVG